MWLDIIMCIDITYICPYIADDNIQSKTKKVNKQSVPTIMINNVHTIIRTTCIYHVTNIIWTEAHNYMDV